MLKHISALVTVTLFAFLSTAASAAITLPPMFGDHMVLQRGADVPVWGTAAPDEKVTIKYANQSVEATADDKGEWRAKLAPLAKGDAASMTISGDKSDKAIVLQDVIPGDVWICSGQSNMQFMTKQAKNAQEELETAKFPNIRFFQVPSVTSVSPTKELHGAWTVCTPKTAGDFSAVGYFFGREIHKLEDVPVGLIHNSWGGMPAESFTSDETLKSDPDFAKILEHKRAPTTQDGERAKLIFKSENARWEKRYLHKDESNEGEKNGWQKETIDESDWKEMKLPQHWEDAGLKIDGSVWFRRQIDIPSDWANKDLELTLGGIDDFDTTYFNGEKVGDNHGPIAVLVQRDYTIPAADVKAGKATIAVRVFDQMGDGGFYGPPVSMKLGVKGDDSIKPIALEGEWKYKVEKAIDQPATIPPRPQAPIEANAPFLASNIYNAMVYPLEPYAIKGAIWYQGESNADRAWQYRKLFPAMIADWRKNWGQGDFPFLFVQLANFANFKENPKDPAPSQWAELREAQTMTLEKSPSTGMAVAIDVGESKDIHPKNKQDVGKRLALAAESVAYGKKDVEFSGPMYDGMKIEGDKIRIRFTHAKGLMSKDGDPKGFAIAGEDQKFQWAEAKIEGDEVVVSSKDVTSPKAVRYGWADDPQVNLYNAAGLPACPFRTDDWKMVTANAR